jgi:hypothetical protein
MKEHDLYKLIFTINSLRNLAKVNDELQAEYTQSQHQFDRGAASSYKTINNSLKPLITDLEEVLADLKAQVEPYMYEDINFYEGSDESA